jgi:hypothetical protein
MELLRRVRREMEEAKKSGNQEALLRIYGSHRRELEELNEELRRIDSLRREAELGAPEAEERGPHGGILVKKYVYCSPRRCRGCPHGPYLYEVVSGGGRKTWFYLGKAPPEPKRGEGTKGVG